jgi:hypothetical protein
MKEKESTGKLCRCRCSFANEPYIVNQVVKHLACHMDRIAAKSTSNLNEILSYVDHSTNTQKLTTNYCTSLRHKIQKYTNALIENTYQTQTKMLEEVDKLEKSENLRDLYFALANSSDLNDCSSGAAYPFESSVLTRILSNIEISTKILCAKQKALLSLVLKNRKNTFMDIEKCQYICT